LRQAWYAAQDAATTFDEAISDAYFNRSQAAYTAYLTALCAHIGVPLPYAVFGLPQAA
jgi:hypothetical protein